MVIRQSMTENKERINCGVALIIYFEYFSCSWEMGKWGNWLDATAAEG